MNLQNWHPGKLMVFCGLSAADLVFTYRLICLSGGQVYESNPVAHAWLSAYGWMGLAGFKLGMVLIVIASALFITRSQPKTAGRLLGFACLAVAFVVGYSYKLGGSHELVANHSWKAPPNLLLMEGAATPEGKLPVTEAIFATR